MGKWGLEGVREERETVPGVEGDWDWLEPGDIGNRSWLGKKTRTGSQWERETGTGNL